MVSIGGVGLLISNAIFHDGWGKVVGGAIFSLAMFVVTTFGLYLITGLSTKIITMHTKHVWSLPTCLFFNVVGIALSALLVYYSHVEIQVEAALLMDTKICDDGWVVHSLCSGILCGLLIGLSVFLSKYTAKKHLSATIGVMFPVFVFVFCGFDNSLANLFYTFVCGHMDWTMIAYCFVSMIGNLIGGIMVSVLPLLKKKDEPKKYKCPCCGYFTFEKKERTYDICPVCFWEEDALLEADEPSDANHGLTLSQAQKNYQSFGACEKESLKFVRGPKPEELTGIDD